ncbi:MAG: hypothetical protein KJN80_01210, partial [Deltaproteobacteria bacterium]|nr:hypothetical protein [Deltaproteobacteria bacterium]
ELIEDYKEKVEEGRNELINDLDEQGRSNQEIEKKLEEYDRLSVSGLEKLEATSEKDLRAMQEKAIAEDCIFEPRYMFMFSQMVIEDSKDDGSWDQYSTAEKVAGTVLGIPAVLAVDILMLPLTILTGIFGPKYCD